MNAIRLWAPMLVLAFVSPLQAVLVDFDDLAAGTTFTFGNSFTSGGFQFDVIDYNGRGPGTSINVVESTVSTEGRYLNMNNTIGIRLNFSSSFGLMEFEFGDFCSSCSAIGITINGQSSLPTVQLTALDGTTLGGVDIEVIQGTGPIHRMRLTGPTTSFATGGTEYRFDNLRISVPEPAAGILTVSGIVGFFSRRRR